MDEKVSLFNENEDENLLIDDGGTKLSLVKDAGVPQGFGFCISDEGGFTGILVSIKCWEKMKAIVDKFIAESDHLK